MTKLVAVVGGKHSGKTTVVENLITELKLRGYRVGAVKEMVRIPTLDIPEKETGRYSKAGAEIIVAVPRQETVIFVKKRLPLKDLLVYTKSLDYAVLEGFESEKAIPKIMAIKNFDEAQQYFNNSVFVISGIITEIEKEQEVVSTHGIPMLNSKRDIKQIVNVVEQKALDSALVDF